MQKNTIIYMILFFLANLLTSNVWSQPEPCKNAIILDFYTSENEKNFNTQLLTEDVTNSLLKYGCKIFERRQYTSLINETELLFYRNSIDEIRPELNELNVKTIITGSVFESVNGDLMLNISFHNIETAEIIKSKRIRIPANVLSQRRSRTSLINQEIGNIISVKMDSDGDGILDSEDRCPNEFGTSDSSGCPDSDADGIPDYEDKCPYERGSIKAQGCPENKNSDYDKLQWEIARYKNTISAYQEYLAKFPKGEYYQLALEQLKTIAASNGIPVFPFPPPKPSAIDVITIDKFPDANNLEDINNFIGRTLNQCGYHEKSIYEIPNGFALVSRIEKINSDASSKNPPERWEINSKVKNSFSISDYIKSLFSSNPGFYRVIVFMVTDIPFNTTKNVPSKEDATDWLYNGLNILPDEIGSTTLNQSYSCSVLIYEFKSPESGESAFLMSPSLHTGREHLIKANLWSYLIGND